MRVNFTSLKTEMTLRPTCMGSRGFSLVELLVGLAIAAIAMAAIIGMFTTLTRSYTTQNASASVQQAGRAAMEYMVQNIRMAGLNPTRIENVGILEATSTRIKFNLDRNTNGEIDFVDEEHMTFSYDPVDQQINEGLYIDDEDHKSWNPLVEHVTNLSFSYRDGDGVDLGPAPNLADIKTVEIFLTIAQLVPQNQNPVSRTYSARIICRNLGLD